MKCSSGHHVHLGVYANSCTWSTHSFPPAMLSIKQLYSRSVLTSTSAFFSSRTVTDLAWPYIAASISGEYGFSSSQTVYRCKYNLTMTHYYIIHSDIRQLSCVCVVDEPCQKVHWALGVYIAWAQYSLNECRGHSAGNSDTQWDKATHQNKYTFSLRWTRHSKCVL